MKAPNNGAKLSVAKKMLVMFAAFSCSMLKRFTRYVVKFAATPNEAAFSNVSFAAIQNRQAFRFSTYSVMGTF
uniref:Uncharacterized protein n=1 Tax=Arundo donax TaxID=35708 RepID=A0A0A9D3E6_ARUDO